MRSNRVQNWTGRRSTRRLRDVLALWAAWVSNENRLKSKSFVIMLRSHVSRTHKAFSTWQSVVVDARLSSIMGMRAVARIALLHMDSKLFTPTPPHGS